MINMSFYNGTLDKVKAKKAVLETDKELRYTYGLGYRNPTTNKVLVDKQNAISIIDNESLLDIKEYENYIHLNAYSTNDMF